MTQAYQSFPNNINAGAVNLTGGGGFADTSAVIYGRQGANNTTLMVRVTGTATASGTITPSYSYFNNGVSDDTSVLVPPSARNSTAVQVQPLYDTSFSIQGYVTLDSAGAVTVFVNNTKTYNTYLNFEF